MSPRQCSCADHSTYSVNLEHKLVRGPVTEYFEAVDGGPHINVFAHWWPEPRTGGGNVHVNATTGTAPASLTHKFEATINSSARLANSLRVT